jgi:hypothetical protein
MENTYVIVWIAIENQRVGVGKSRLSKDEAETLAAELNADHPAFLHIPVDTATEDVAQALSRAKASVVTPEPANIIQFPDFIAEEAANIEAVEV